MLDDFTAARYVADHGRNAQRLCFNQCQGQALPGGKQHEHGGLLNTLSHLFACEVSSDYYAVVAKQFL